MESSRRIWAGALGAVYWLCTALPVAAQEMPHILLVSVDTLRADRLSSYGYERDTTPSIDRVMDEGVRFTQARTVEPLTGPGLSSMITSLYPHEHGATRNGVRMRKGLPSFTKILQRRGYATAAFLANWTLGDDVSGLGEHFETFDTVLTRKRWFLWSGEARADDINEAALDWLTEHRASNPSQHVAMWVHFVEPHAPYEFHGEYAERLGIAEATPGRQLRYDTEVAYVDERVGRLLESVEQILGGEELLTIFVSDHGESLGERGYWGHGRHCYEPGLRIPLGIRWPGRIEPGTMDAPALIIDISQTVLGLLDLPTQSSFQGYDWSRVLDGTVEAPFDRATLHQSHKGAVKATSSEKVRRRGLLEVARVADGTKEILRVSNGNRKVFDLLDDPNEEEDRARKRSQVSAELSDWLEIVQAGLDLSDELPPPILSEEDIERLRSLGYID